MASVMTKYVKKTPTEENIRSVCSDEEAVAVLIITHETNTMSYFHHVF